MLDVSGIDVWYGKNHVLRDVSFKVGEGEVVALVGSNAAGKTTTMRSLMGLKELRAGTVRLAGADLSQADTVRRVRSGLVLVPEGRQVFPKFSVADNLAMGAYHRAERNDIREEVESVFELFPRLRERRTQKAGSMSGGEQQMLALARGLLAKPKFLLLDEPVLGLAPLIIVEIEHIVRKLAARGIGVLLAEQNAAMALRLASRAYVLESGRISASGSSQELQQNETVRRMYLGT
jgi:branched-chain amino acid transport system ATP-binding protein